MRTRVAVLFASVGVVLLGTTPTSSLPEPSQELVEGWRHSWEFHADQPGLCVVDVKPKVVLFRVECTQPKWKAVIWQGLPRAGDFIDTLGANWVTVQAFYRFEPGEHQLVGYGVDVRVAGWPADWSDKSRRTNTIRVQNPGWDFDLPPLDYCYSRQYADAAGYRVGTPYDHQKRRPPTDTSGESHAQTPPPTQRPSTGPLLGDKLTLNEYGFTGTFIRQGVDMVWTGSWLGGCQRTTFRLVNAPSLTITGVARADVAVVLLREDGNETTCPFSPRLRAEYHLRTSLSGSTVKLEGKRIITNPGTKPSLSGLKNNIANVSGNTALRR